MNTLRRLLTLGLCASALAAVAQPSPAPSCDDPRPLRFALVPTRKAAEHQEQYRPLVQRLESVLQRPVELVSGKSYNAVVQGLIDGSVDLAELGPASYGMALNRGARLSVVATLSMPATPTMAAGSGYSALLVTRRERGHTTVADLRHATLSLTDPASTSGSVIPRRAMERQLGMPLESHFQRITYSGSHDRSLELVRKGLVDAAFVSSTTLDGAIRRGQLRLDELTIVWRSPPIPKNPFVLRRQLCPELQQRIRSAFLDADPSLEAMFRQLGATGFAPVSEEDYREIRSLLDTRP
jgi:phosphonate transport system substrate-binding protein